MRKLTTVIGLVLILVLGLVATVAQPQPARAADGDNLVLIWNQETLRSIRELPPAPTVAARALAMVHTAIYDAWAAYDPLAVGTRLGAKLRQPEAERMQANKDKAVSFAAYLALVDLFPARQEIFGQRMTDLGYVTDGSDTSSAATVGTVAGQAVVDFRHTDGANQVNGYAAQQKFVTPHWRDVTPFALTSAAQFRPDHGPAVTVLKGKPSDAFRKEVDQQLTFSAGLTDTQKVIALYWEDPPGSETPPGHWNLFAQWVSRRDHHSLDTDAKVFMALNNALLDAGISAWDAKRQWNSVRPITAVRWLKKGQLIQAWVAPIRAPGPSGARTGCRTSGPTSSPLVPRIPVGALDLQRRRRHAPQISHWQRHLRDVGQHPGWQLHRGATNQHPAGGAGCSGDAILEVVHRLASS